MKVYQNTIAGQAADVFWYNFIPFRPSTGVSTYKYILVSLRTFKLILVHEETKWRLIITVGCLQINCNYIIPFRSQKTKL